MPAMSLPVTITRGALTLVVPGDRVTFHPPVTTYALDLAVDLRGLVPFAGKSAVPFTFRVAVSRVTGTPTDELIALRAARQCATTFGYVDGTIDLSPPPVGAISGQVTATMPFFAEMIGNTSDVRMGTIWIANACGYAYRFEAMGDPLVQDGGLFTYALLGSVAFAPCL